MEKRREDAYEQDIYSDIRRGWRLVAEDFVDRLRDRIEVAVRDRHEAFQARDTMQCWRTESSRKKLLGDA